MEMETHRLSEIYRSAKEFILERGFGPEIDWQRNACFERVTEQAFLAEAAWVVLSCGMREAVVRKSFSAVSEAFHWWESASRIADGSGSCIRAALRSFNHRGKIHAVAKISHIVHEIGFGRLKEEIGTQGVIRLEEFPFMGPATSYHLAKNIGMDVVKPDRHLLRIAETTGFGCPDRLCRTLTELVGDRVSVVDLVLWRFATLVPDYLSCFSSSSTKVLPGPHP